LKFIEVRNRKHEIVDYTKVSDCDYEEVSKYNWTQHNQGYVCAKINGQMTLLHRFVMSLKTGHTNFSVVDHINHNKYDNTRENLRIVTAAANARNRQKAIGKISQYKGVTRRTLGSGAYRYIARLFTAGNKVHYGGSYKTEAEAAMAYDRLAIKYFGEYACLNFA